MRKATAVRSIIALESTIAPLLLYSILGTAIINAKERGSINKKENIIVIDKEYGKDIPSAKAIYRKIAIDITTANKIYLDAFKKYLSRLLDISEPIT